jgi:enamine deaminase RidA (YjgF/YER057c/UK114 family)
MNSSPHVVLLPETGPFDDRGLLLHEDDAAAQLALSLACLEAAVAEAGHEVDDVHRIRVRTVDVRLLDDVYDVLTERLEHLGVSPEIEVAQTDGFGVAGTLMTLQATITLTKEQE